jgi:hypothetical protein
MWPEVMVEILRCQDQWGRTVVLTRERWVTHVLRGRRREYFQGNERACVESKVTHPEFVKHDIDFSNRECFYRPSPLPPPYGGVFVKVVVAYQTRANGVDLGTVITVHLTSGPKTGEIQERP